MSEKQALVAFTTMTIAPAAVPPASFFFSSAASAGSATSSADNKAADVKALSMVTLNHVWSGIARHAISVPQMRDADDSNQPHGGGLIACDLAAGHVDHLHAAVLVRIRIGGVLQLGLAVADGHEVGG